QLNDRLKARYGTLYLIPSDIEVSDFVPRVLHFQHTPGTGILGVTFLGTGEIGYNHNARILDYMKGRPVVLQHEMVHANSKLQRLLQEVADYELMASIPEMLYAENSNDLMRHGYVSLLRRLCHVHFGYDFRKASKEFVRWDFVGNLIIDPQAFATHYASLEVVKKELATVFRDEIFPELYAFYIWWGALHDRLIDTNAYIRICMARRYAITALGGRKKSAEWLAENALTIKNAADESFRETAKKQENSDKNLFGFSPSLINTARSMFTPEEQSKIADHFKNHPEDAKMVFDLVTERKFAEVGKFFARLVKQLGPADERER
ncbi:MAG: hypothetical protein WC797_04225, partial [Candidatus Paceibacterota bacterium]